MIEIRRQIGTETRNHYQNKSMIQNCNKVLGDNDKKVGIKRITLPDIPSNLNEYNRLAIEKKGSSRGRDASLDPRKPNRQKIHFG